MIDGESLVPLLKREGRCGATPSSGTTPTTATRAGKPGGAVRRGDLKLIEWYEDGRAELYDLKRDLGEKRDLASGRPEDATRLRARLTRWRESVEAQMPTPNPDYDSIRRGP